MVQIQLFRQRIQKKIFRSFFNKNYDISLKTYIMYSLYDSERMYTSTTEIVFKIGSLLPENASFSFCVKKSSIYNILLKSYRSIDVNVPRVFQWIHCLTHTSSYTVYIKIDLKMFSLCHLK